jgi:hypothetical protein
MTTPKRLKRPVYVHSSQDKAFHHELSISHRVFLLTNIALLLFAGISTAFIYGLSSKNEGTSAQSAPANVKAGAEANYNLIDTSKLGRAATRSGSLDDLRNAISAGQLSAGTVFEVNPGNYTGNVTIPASVVGTEANPIIIRSKVRHGAVITSCGGLDSPCWNIQSSYVVVMQFKVQDNGGTSVFRVEGYKNRVYDNYLSGAGDRHEGSYQGYALINSIVPGEHYNLIDKNYIDRPKGIAFSVVDGSFGNIFSHNTVIGPWDMSAPRETEAIKIGCCDNKHSPIPTVFQFNSIINWDGADPYVGSSKADSTWFSYNKISGTSRQYWNVRNPNNNKVVGNFIDNGSLDVMGSGHVIKYNYLRVKPGGEGWYGAGPMVLHNGENGGFYANVTSTTIDSNTLVFGNASGFSAMHAAKQTCSNSGNTITNNTIIAVSANYIDGCIASTMNTLSNNKFIAYSSAGTQATDSDPWIKYDPAYTKMLLSSPASTPTPTPSPSPTPTSSPSPTPTPTPTPAPTPGPANVLQAETAQLLGGTKASNQDVSQYGAGHSGSDGGYVYNWAPATSGAGVRFSFNASTAGTYKMAIRYTANAADIPQKQIKTNSTTVTYSFPKTANWDSWADMDKINVALVKGQNTIDIISDASFPANGWLNIDKITLTLTIPATATSPTPPPPATPPKTNTGTTVQVTKPAVTTTTTVSPIKTAAGTPVAVNTERFTAEEQENIESVVIMVNGEEAPVTNGTNADTALDTSKLKPGTYEVTEQITFKDGSSVLSSSYVTVEDKYASLKRKLIPAGITLSIVSTAGIIWATYAIRKRRAIMLFGGYGDGFDIDAHRYFWS